MIHQILFSFIFMNSLIQMVHSSDLRRNKVTFQPSLDHASCKDCPYVKQLRESLEDKLHGALDIISQVKKVESYNQIVSMSLRITLLLYKCLFLNLCTFYRYVCRPIRNEIGVNFIGPHVGVMNVQNR